jgi:hypothetical protein
MPADPFADFDQFDTEGLRPTWMVPTTTPAVRAAVRVVTGAPEPMDESIGRITAVLVSADRARLAYVLDEGAAGIYVVDIAHVVPPREVDHLDNTWQLLEGNPL